jgi:hypothetical protein
MTSAPTTLAITRQGYLDGEIVADSDGTTARFRLVVVSTDEEVDTWVIPCSTNDATLTHYLLTECRPDDLLQIDGTLHLPTLDHPDQPSWVDVNSIEMLQTAPARENPDSDHKLADLIGPEHTAELLDLWTQQTTAATGRDWRSAFEIVQRRLAAGDPDLLAASGQTWTLNRPDAQAPGLAVQITHRAAGADTVTARILGPDFTPGPDQALPISALASYTLTHWTQPTTPAIGN